MSKVYLAGPISGLTYGASEIWRTEFIATLKDYPSIECFSPLRAKEYLVDAGVLEQSYAQPLSCGRGIMTRDHNDCLTSDVIVCNLTGVQRVSIGSVMECAWAHAYRKPLIMIMEKGNVHEHPMIREAIGFHVETVAEAAMIVKALLRP